MSILYKPNGVQIDPWYLLGDPKLVESLGKIDSQIGSIADSLGADYLGIKRDVFRLSALSMLETRAKVEKTPILSANHYAEGQHKDLLSVRSIISGVDNPRGAIYRRGESSKEYCSSYIYPLLRTADELSAGMNLDSFGLPEPPFYLGCNFFHSDGLADCIVGVPKNLEFSLPGYDKYVRENSFLEEGCLKEFGDRCVFQGLCSYSQGITQLVADGNSPVEGYLLTRQEDLLGLARAVEADRIGRKYLENASLLENMAGERAELLLSGFRKAEIQALIALRNAQKEWRASMDDLHAYA